MLVRTAIDEDESRTDLCSAFVPRLRSITDTSYFPTDEIEQAPEDAPADSSEASKDLAFLGWVLLHNACYQY